MKHLTKSLSYLKKLNLIRLFNLVGRDRKIIALLACVVFIIANLMMSYVSFRTDLSYGKAYTLSSSTKKILKDLDDVITVKFFVSSDLPNQLIPLKTDVVDLLNEYKKAGGNKINTKVLDPKKDEAAKSEAAAANIPELQFSQVENDKYALTTAQFGIAIAYGDKTEVIPQVTNIESLEYNLTSAVYKMTKKELPKIGIVGYPPSYNPQEDQLAPIKSVLERQFVVDYVDVSSSSATQKIDPSYGAVMVFDNRQTPYSQAEVDAIQEYLDNKGNAVFFVDGAWIQENLTTGKANNGLTGLLKEYGIVVQENLLLSTSAEFVNFGNSGVSFMVPYPFWMKTNAFNSKSSYFSNVGQLTYPWASALKIEKKPGVEVSELVKSSKRSWEQKEPFSLNPESIPEPKISDLKEYVVGAQSSRSGKGKLVVIPSSRFVLAQFLSRNSGNVPFVVNVLSEMGSKGELSGMSQRAVQFYPVPDMTEQKKDTFKYMNILLLPAALGIFGALRLMKRK